MSRKIDLRSDTVTKPTPAMREAMFQAEVGDDVYGEDPTVNALQEKAAALLGHEAALFVSSGTMANQLAIRTLTSLGDDVLMNEDAHPFRYESGAPAAVSSVQLHTLPAKRGIMTAAQIEAAINPDDIHFPPTSLVCLENTHNRGGGAIYPLETIAEISAVAKRRGLAMHLDGARLFNACVASGVKPAEYARHFNTVSFCLSKGLGAPVGSMLAGDRDIIKRARRWRKMLGGGMRQIGFLAAAGIYALDHHIDRLAEDHENARLMAEGLSRIQGLETSPDEVETNIVLFRIIRQGLTPVALQAELARTGLLVTVFGPDQIRAVTHLDVSRSEIEQAVGIIARVMNA